MKVLVVGANGQLGHCLRDRWPAAWALMAPSSHELDIRHAAQVQRFVTAHRPDAIVNAAAYNAVDAAERDPAMAFAVNATGPGILADAAADVGARLLHISTDYVFDGRSEGIAYTEDAAPDPLSEYGRSKRQGEVAVLEKLPQAVVLRTAWLFSEHGSNFVKTMLELGRSRSRLTVVADQIGCPTYAGDLAQAVIRLLSRKSVPGGIYHYCGADAMSWFEFARKILDAEVRAGRVDVVAVSTAEYGALAPRPAYSVLSCAKMRALGIEPGPLEPSLVQVKRRLKAAL